MRYAEFLERRELSQTELLALSQGNAVEDAPPEFLRLPAPPMLMIDRVVEITRNGPRGRIVGERDVRLDDWFFQCHFRGDPVQPGCLGVDAVWQLIGLYCAASGATGAGRALGCGEVEFSGQIRPRDRLVRYEVEIRRFSVLPASGAAVAVGSAVVYVDGAPIYRIKDARVGAFRDLAYDDYPHETARSRGGILGREP